MTPVTSRRRQNNSRAAACLRGTRPLISAESALQAQSQRRHPEGLRRLRPQSAEPRTFLRPRPARIPTVGFARDPQSGRRGLQGGQGPLGLPTMGRPLGPACCLGTEPTRRVVQTAPRRSASQPHQPQSRAPTPLPTRLLGQVLEAALSPSSLRTALPYIHFPSSQGDHLPARSHPRPPGSPFEASPGSLLSHHQAPQSPTSGWKERPLPTLSTRPPRPARNTGSAQKRHQQNQAPGSAAPKVTVPCIVLSPHPRARRTRVRAQRGLLVALTGLAKEQAPQAKTSTSTSWL